MTIGEKIQKYRKELGMSQEELGQKLLVSRQTISLWEKNQTFPTIDNLIRLRDVFGVSIDEILDLEENVNDKSLPFESYQFNYNETELNEIYRFQRNSFYKGPLFIALLLTASIISLIYSSETKFYNNFMTGTAIGVLAVHLYFYIKGFLAYKKNWQGSVKYLCKSTYDYKIYEDYFYLNVYRNDEIIRSYKCYFSDIENIQILQNWLLLQFGGNMFILKKNDLKENSAFYSYLYVNTSKAVTPKKYKVCSNILFVGSLFSLLVGLDICVMLSEMNSLFVENMWAFFLPVVIPVASVAYGFFLKSKGYKYKKNIIAGIVMTIFLCIYGSFVFMF